MRAAFVICVSIAVLTLGFAGFALLARFVIHGPVDASSLHVALERESGSAGGILQFGRGRCRSTAKREWRCGVIDRSGSGGADYRVRQDKDSSCWNARRIGSGSVPRRVTGCVYLWQWTLFD